MAHVVKVTFMENSEWKLPFTFAIVLHLSIALGAVYGPALFNRKPPYQDIYTVDLINIAEPVVQTPAKPEKSTPPKIEKPEKKKVSVAPPPEQPPVQEIKEVVKPVSIKPLKRKKIKKVVKQTSAKKDLERIHKKNLEAAREAERKAAEAARLAASEAVDQLKDLLRESNSLSSPQKTNKATPTQTVSARKSTNVVENQYYASVFSQLQPHWRLPEYKQWDDALFALVIIRIAKDGRIISQSFEQKSGDRIFDKFVLKALQDGSPLPPIPAALQKNSIEIGLRFVPGSIK